jgi:hypothetical protein
MARGPSRLEGAFRLARSSRAQEAQLPMAGGEAGRDPFRPRHPASPLQSSTAELGFICPAPDS